MLLNNYNFFNFLIFFLILFVISSIVNIYKQVNQKDNVRITSHNANQQVQVGVLTISGNSTDDSVTDCRVYAYWNNKMPPQSVLANGTGGKGDYSQWTFTYPSNYSLIKLGNTNNLTAQLSCLTDKGIITNNFTINIIGVEQKLQLSSPGSPTNPQGSPTNPQGSPTNPQGSPTNPQGSLNQSPDGSLNQSPDGSLNQSPDGSLNQSPDV